MWRHVVVEGYCFAKDNPCGYGVVSSKCLANGHCPHFAYAESNEREAAYFVPLHLIAYDKLKYWVTEGLYWTLRWWLWDRLRFNRKKMEDFINSIPSARCPAWDNQLEEAKEKFPEWIKGTNSQ